MTELPPSWEATTIGEIADVGLGRQRSPKNHTGNHMRPYLRSANVTWDGIDLSDVKEMNFDPDDAKKFELQQGDLLLNEASGSPSEVGKPAIWNNEIPGACFQNTLLRVTTRGPLTKFLYWYCYRSALLGEFGEAGRGVNIRHLGKRGLDDFPIPLPPLAEQERIVAAIEEHFSHLDAAEASLHRAQHNLDRLLASVWAEALADLDDYRPVGEVAEVQGGIQKQPKRKPTTNRFPFLRVANVKRNELELDDVHEIELFDGELDRYRLQSGDLLVVEGNGSPEQIGRSASWDDSIPDCVHQNHLIRVRPGPELDADYLNWFWNAPSTARQLAGVASSTSGLYTLSTRKVKQVEVPVPPLETQRRVADLLDDKNAAVDRLHSQVAQAQRRSEQLRRAVLTAAFSGRLVPQNPADEPASGLLDRIRAAAPPKKKSTRKKKSA